MKKLFKIFCGVLIISVFSGFSAGTINSITQNSLEEILKTPGLIIPQDIAFQKSSFEVNSSVFTSNQITPIYQYTSHLNNKNKKNKKIINNNNCQLNAKVPIEIKSQFLKATENIPCEFLQGLRTIEIFNDPEHIYPRAMANGRILKIRSDVIESPEFIDILIHELGHVVDLSGLQSKKFKNPSIYKDGKKIIYADDLSIQFYKISWKTETQKKQNTNNLDFVGEYAASDMFEDYAESFLMYIEHGNEFRIMATKNEALQKKYNFLREHIFHEKEFFTGTYKVNTKERQWDITRYVAKK